MLEPAVEEAEVREAEEEDDLEADADEDEAELADELALVLALDAEELADELAELKLADEEVFGAELVWTPVAPEIWKELEKLTMLESVVEAIWKLYWPLLTLVGIVKVAVPEDAETVINSMPEPG